MRGHVALVCVAWVVLLTCSCGRVDFEDLPGPDGAIVDTGADVASGDVGPGDVGPGDGGGDTGVRIVDAASDARDAGRTVQITVSRTGAGVGAVVADSGAPGLSCGAVCVVDVPVGTTVTVTSTASAGSWFEGWGTGPCSGRARCSFAATSDATIEARFTRVPNRIFVSSTTHDGSFGGLAGADADCGVLASAAGLSGSWIALLSTSAITSFSRLSGSRGFIRMDDAPVADQSLSFALWYPVRLDEYGVDVGAADIWGLNRGAPTDLCADFTTNSAMVTGHIQNADRGWSFQSGGGGVTCDQSFRFVCAEVGKTVAISPSPTVGRGAFVTVGTWLPDGGLASADVLCAAEATAAGRSGTYGAFLATDGAAGIDRFSGGLPWVRSDGMPLLPTRADWLTAADLDVSPVYDATGAAHLSRLVLSGAATLGSPGTLASTCQDWTTTVGMTSACIRTWSTQAGCVSGTSCSATRLLCLEE
ncbi:MAG: hypothetical protein DRJ42_01505 [Deltaproteobacteria bacterium]|nr:MAG: hypothetical protein DRJ42_01505 [Deltaproteobacteria bacterium]